MSLLTYLINTCHANDGSRKSSPTLGRLEPRAFGLHHPRFTLLIRFSARQVPLAAIVLFRAITLSLSVSFNRTKRWSCRITIPRYDNEALFGYRPRIRSTWKAETSNRIAYPYYVSLFSRSLTLRVCTNSFFDRPSCSLPVRSSVLPLNPAPRPLDNGAILPRRGSAVPITMQRRGRSQKLSLLNF